jgi:hypothetical protein
MVPPSISSGPNAIACVNIGRDPSASPPASTQYQKNLWFPVLVIDIPQTYGRPPADPSLARCAWLATRKTMELCTGLKGHSSLSEGCWTGSVLSMLKVANVRYRMVRRGLAHWGGACLLRGIARAMCPSVDSAVRRRTSYGIYKAA